MTWRAWPLDGVQDGTRSVFVVRECDLCCEMKPLTHCVTESEDGTPGMWDWTVCSQACADRAVIQAAIVGEPPWA